MRESLADALAAISSVTGPLMGAAVAFALIWPRNIKDATSRLVICLIFGWTLGPLILELLEWIGFRSATVRTGEIIGGLVAYPVAGVLYGRAAAYIAEKMAPPVPPA